MELWFPSVIAIWCVFFACFFSVCSVPSCFVLMWVFSLISVFLVQHIDGGRYREAASCAILQVLSDGSLLSSSCSRVSQNSDTICFVLVIVEISWPHNRVGPEEIVLNFNKFQFMAPPLGYVSISSVGVDLCKHGQMLNSIVMLRVFCIWQLMWSCMQH